MTGPNQKVEIIEQLRTSVIQGDSNQAELAANRALEAGIDPLEAIEQGLAKGIREVGEKFQKLDLFLTDMIIAAEAMTAAISVLEKDLPEKGTLQKRGTVVIATVAGDIHDIGKNIVVALLKANSLRVTDLGKDIPSRDLVDQAESSHADVIGLSALLSTTMVAQQEVLMMLQDLRLRDKYRVIVGGAPVTEQWAKQIGADAYGKDANEGVVKVQELLTEKLGREEQNASRKL
jgi:corrinoid protein of di/trimethylamine methyltransferase